MKEEQEQKILAQWLRMKYPNVIFHSDFGSGAKLTMGQAQRQKALNGGRRAWPDLFIAEPNKNYAGLFIEFKRTGTKLYKKDGSLISNSHVQEQDDVLDALRFRGYRAIFACGFEEAKKVIMEYLDD